ncbi:MAG: hypothetical protein ACRERE_12300 [Candidatus Entotheonellia bacterium]
MRYAGSLRDLERQYRHWLASAKPLLEAHDYPGSVQDLSLRDDVLPRALFLRYPFGHPLGEAFQVQQQRTILLQALKALETLTEPGTILEPGYTWRRHRFDEHR